MAKLITEVSYDFEISESSNGKDMYLVGIFSTAELKNQNERIYSRSILEREVKKLQEKMEKRPLFGELDHPTSPSINSDRVAIKVEDLTWKGNNVYGKAKILDTPMGNIAKTLVKEGGYGISSRGLGTVSESGNVNEDFNMRTYDLVDEPSNSPSWLKGIYEGKDFSVDGETISNNINQLEEAKKAYKRHIWQVIENIEKSL